MDETIAGWSPADLRRFVVNTILTDPGAYPAQPKDDSPKLPTQPGLVNNDVPVWDSTKNAWEPNRVMRLPQDLQYIRAQGQPGGFIVDTAFRIYNWSSLVTEYEQNDQGYFTNNGSYMVVNKTGNYIISMQSVGPNAGNYTLGFCPVYNGVSIDSIAGSISDESHVIGVIQQMSSVGFTIAHFNAGDYIQIGGFCNSGVPTVVICLIALPS